MQCMLPVQVSLTSLEEVFLAIARRAEQQHAIASGKGSVTIHLDDGGALEVRTLATQPCHPREHPRHPCGLNPR